MGKRFVGGIFILSAALLFIARYIAAAIFMSGVSSWSAELFSVGLEYIGAPLLVLSVISFLIGVFYLLWAEFSDKVQNIHQH